jgi:hypothetical protein
VWRKKWSHIAIWFQDDTNLTFVMDPALTFQADYSKWKAANQKVLKLAPGDSQQWHVRKASPESPWSCVIAAGAIAARIQALEAHHRLAVTFQEVVPSSKTREADCDEQSVQIWKPEWTFIRMPDLP